MTATIIDGAAIAAGIRDALTRQVADMIGRGLLPHLAVILVGDNPASASYVRSKVRAGEQTGVKVVIHRIEVDPDPMQTQRRIPRPH